MSTGETVRQSMECIEYYGGDIVGVSSIFSTRNVVESTSVFPIFTIEDLINHYPFRYEVLKRSDISILNQDDKIIIDGIVETIPTLYRFKGNMNKMQFNINIGTNILKVVIFNRGFLKNHIKVSERVVVIGKYDKKNNSIIASDIMLNIDLNIPKPTTNTAHNNCEVTNGDAFQVWKLLRFSYPA